jgi:hypothetical protein
LKSLDKSSLRPRMGRKDDPCAQGDPSTQFYLHFEASWPAKYHSIPLYQKEEAFDREDRNYGKTLTEKL